MKSIIEKFEDWVNKNPEKTLFSFLNIHGNVIEEYSYESFQNRIDLIAGILFNNFSFKKNDRVLLVYPPGIEIICSFFACVKIGLIPVPGSMLTNSNSDVLFSKLDRIAKDCGASAVLTNSDNIKITEKQQKRPDTNIKSWINSIKWIDTTSFDPSGKIKFDVRFSEILFLQYTSGSTSQPKGVKVSHSNILHNADLAVDHIPIGVSWLPQYHDMGLIGYYLFFALKGGTTYGFSPFDFIRKPSLWFEVITKYHGTASSAPNFAYEYCIQPGKISQEVLNKIDLSSLRYLMTAAEPIKQETYNKFINFFKPYGLNPESYFAAYGLAENTLAVTNYGRKSLSIEYESLKKNILKISSNGYKGYVKIMSCGKPLGDINVKIIDPVSKADLGTNSIGEVWIDGPSKCLGYWNKPELTSETFNAEISNKKLGKTFLRTGDLGFFRDNELFICGRIKDMIIIRGLNYYPQDIESLVEKSSDKISKESVVAFSYNSENTEKLVVVVGVKNKNHLPDPINIKISIKKVFDIECSYIAFVSRKSIPKTTSGKLMRQKTKKLWINNNLEIIAEHNPSINNVNTYSPKSISLPIVNEIVKKYGITGNEDYSLVDILDSFDLVSLLYDIKELFKSKGAVKLSEEVDIVLLQKISVSDFFNYLIEFQSSPTYVFHKINDLNKKIRNEQKIFEQKLMLKDSKLPFIPLCENQIVKKTGNVFLTGGTGFLGPFILKSLLEQTNTKIYVLVRSKDANEGKKRLQESFLHTEYKQTALYKAFDNRVFPICGDLTKKQFGLSNSEWDFLSKNIDTIYNNGAWVNYIYSYEKLRDVNVFGTNEIIRFATNGIKKELNHISTTFIFGWAVKETLFEFDNCESLDLLDFGYSQSKWVSEQLVFEAMRHGIQARIFRPALITPSIKGGGYNFDISIRLLSFMILKNIGVNTFNQVSFMPVDIVANNIVAISNMKESINQTFHVTREKYSNMMDITAIIENMTETKMTYYSLNEFVPEVIKLCSKEDLLFPLLDFLVKSEEKIAAMEFKLYDNKNYLEFLEKSPFCMHDPSLEETVKGILLFLRKHKIIDINIRVNE